MPECQVIIIVDTFQDMNPVDTTVPPLGISPYLKKKQYPGYLLFGDMVACMDPIQILIESDDFTSAAVLSKFRRKETQRNLWLGVTMTTFS